MYIDLPKNKKYLLAISGGLDSCVLFHLLKAQGFEFDAAHCNFKLRGTASDQDEQFVMDLCQKNNVFLYTKTLDVNRYKKQHGMSSTQIAARDLRYHWFFELKKKHGYNAILTAHHFNDAMETFLINLLRGTGLNGLLGIKNNTEVLRPMLHISKDLIIAYAKQHNLSWREDASNQSDDYVRNNIRHHVIPKLKEIDLRFENSFAKTIDNLQQDKDLLDDYIDLIRSKVTTYKDEMLLFDINLLQQPLYKKALFYLFSPYGFNAVLEIEKLMQGQNSAEIMSSHYRLIKERQHLLLLKKHPQKAKVYPIEDCHTQHLPIPLKLKVSNNNRNAKVSFDFKSVKFPLSLRLKKSGDIFYPKGMHGKSKKVSKYFKDLKLSKIEKENTWLLCDAEDRILWIVGHRQDQRFLPTNKTTKWLIAEN